MFSGKVADANTDCRCETPATQPTLTPQTQHRCSAVDANTDSRGVCGQRNRRRDKKKERLTDGVNKKKQRGQIDTQRERKKERETPTDRQTVRNRDRQTERERETKTRRERGLPFAGAVRISSPCRGGIPRPAVGRSRQGPRTTVGASVAVKSDFA